MVSLKFGLGEIITMRNDGKARRKFRKRRERGMSGSRRVKCFASFFI